MTAATEPLTIHLPEATIRRLRRVAAISGRLVDQVIAETLDSSLPPLLEDVPEAFHEELAALEPLNSEELRKELHAKLEPEQVARYDALLEANSASALTEAEKQELAMLRHVSDSLMFRKAYAA